MTQNQIAYLNYLETHRSNVVQEGIARDTLAETTRSHRENESINWFSAKEQGRHNLVSEDIEKTKAAAAQVQASAAQRQAAAAESQAQTAARNFLINVTNADTARMNASTAAKQATTAKQQADTAEKSVWTRLFSDTTSSVASGYGSYLAARTGAQGKISAAQITAAARAAAK